MKNLKIKIVFLALIGSGFFSIYAQTPTDSLVNAAIEDAHAAIDSTLKSVKAAEQNAFTNKALLDSYRKSYPVLVTRFHARIVLHPKEGYFDVEENYGVLFNEQRHGIYRNIPLVYRLDNAHDKIAGKAESGESLWADKPEKRRIKITNVEVPGHTVKVSGGRFSGMKNIRIGDAGKYVQGPVKYTIKYRVENAFLFDEKASYFYWNLMGDQWGFPFLESSFEVHLPGNPEAGYFVYSGVGGSTTTQAEYTYEKGVFSGKGNEVLGMGKDMTLLLRLPADYITRPSAWELWWNEYGWVIFPPLVIILFVIAWYIWGRDKKQVKTVEYFPPEGTDPALAGFLVDEDADNRDLTALIPYWGAKGLLSMEIAKPEKKSFKLNAGVIVTVMLGGFFLLVFFIVWIASDSIWNILGSVGSLFPFVIVAIIVMAKAFKNYNNADFTLHHKKELPPDAKTYERELFDGLFADRKSVSSASLKNSFYTTMAKGKSKLLDYSRGMYFTKYSRRNIIITAVICVLTGIVGGILLGYHISILGGVLFFFTCLGLSFFSGVMRKRIVKGDEMLRKTEGFRMFIKKAKKKELEWLLKENPTYFEDTLAYAVAFGLIEKYGRKFEGLVSTPPTWYSGTGARFSMARFSNSFDSAMRSTASTMVSRPSSSGSGSGGGGGFSGGGFGGGGGGSW